MKTYQIALGLMLLFFSLGTKWVFAEDQPALVVGMPAPEFVAKNQEGKEVELKKLLGKPVLLYFYPKDDTPGCTRQACDLRDKYQTYQSLGVVILGISMQDSKSHQEFKQKHKLPFDLLTDEGAKIADKYGVDRMPIYGFHKRQSFLIDSKGKIALIMRNVDTRTHADDILKALQTK